MSYNPIVFKKVREEFENKRLEAENAAEKRRAEAESQIPGLAETDRKLERTGPRLMAIALHRSNETVEEVKADVTRLRAEHEHAFFDTARYEIRGGDLRLKAEQKPASVDRPDPGRV